MKTLVVTPSHRKYPAPLQMTVIVAMRGTGAVRKFGGVLPRAKVHWLSGSDGESYTSHTRVSPRAFLNRSLQSKLRASKYLALIQRDMLTLCEKHEQ